MEKLTQERLEELFSYNPEIGIFKRRTQTANCFKIGSIAGGVTELGYIRIRIDRKKYLAHRLAWLYVYGYFPEHDVDHIDRDSSNNKIDNLRHVGRTCNIRNSGNRKDSSSGVKGVNWYKPGKKWQARIEINRKKRISLGYFVDFDDAVCARLAAEQCVGWSGCDNNSPAYQHVTKEIQDGFNRNT